MISHSHKFIFIHNGKCAGQSIQNTLIRDNPEMSHQDTKHLKLSHPRIKPFCDEYLKVCCVRDPWDRQVSWYHHLKKRGYNTNESFNKFVHASNRNILSYQYINLFDFYIRFEHLHEDYEKFCKKLGLKDKGLLKDDHGNNRPDVKYSEYYDELSIELVRKRNKNVIDKFNYEFKY